LRINALPLAPINPVSGTNCALALGNNPALQVTALATGITEGNVVVDWYDAPVGGTRLVASSNNFTPTNTTTGTYTYYAETRVVNTQCGCTVCVSTNRTAAFLQLNSLPAVPINLGDLTNCLGIPNPQLMVAVPSGVTADWYDAAIGGVLLAQNTTSFTPTNASAGTHTYFAKARSILTGCVSTSVIAVNLTLQDCSIPVSIRLGTNDVILSWFGNLSLQSTAVLTNAGLWNTVTTGAPGVTNYWTNALTGKEVFFRVRPGS
jgi:hypothetical protein